MWRLGAVGRPGEQLVVCPPTIGDGSVGPDLSAQVCRSVPDRGACSGNMWGWTTGQRSLCSASCGWHSHAWLPSRRCGSYKASPSTRPGSPLVGWSSGRCSSLPRPGVRALGDPQRQASAPRKQPHRCRYAGDPRRSPCPVRHESITGISAFMPPGGLGDLRSPA